MEGPPVVLDLLPPVQQGQPIPPAATPPPVFMIPYNISLNFSSILAKLPGSRFLARLRKGVYESPIDPSDSVSSVVEEWATETSSLEVETPAVATMNKLASVPGPWAFFTSGYMLGLFLMTIVLHRMRNVIIPSLIPARRSRHHAFPNSPAFTVASFHPFHYSYIRQRLFFFTLPLDFSCTTSRLALHLPSMYFLSKMLLIWCLLVLQTCQLLPSFDDTQKSAYWGILGHVERLGVWSSQKEMVDICWATFCAVCAALLVEGLMRAIDGLGSTSPIGNVNTNTSPFNLVGYAFLLHAYSFPITHSHKPTDESPSRPDKHAIITITIPLLQLTIFHILSVFKRLSRHRLIPTALTSFLSLAHFHGTLFVHFFRSSSVPAPTPINPIAPLSSLKSTSYLGGSRFTYPLLNYVPNIFETVLIGTILLTIFLNALVQLLVRGRVDRIFSGLGVGLGEDDDTATSGFFQRLPYEEDFGILLLRVGTASLEATGLRGWSNEVAPISLPVNSRNRNRTRGDSFTVQRHGVVRMGRIGVTEVQHGSSFYATTSTTRVGSSSNSSNPYEDLSIRRRRRTTRGLFNEVRTVELGINNRSGSSHGVIGCWRRIKQTWPFFVALWDVSKGLVFFLWDKVRSRRRSQQGGRVEKASSAGGGGHWGEDYRIMGDDDEDVDDTRWIEREKDVYSRFIKGEEISDDECDDDFASSFEDEESLRGVEDDDEEEEGEGEGEADGQGEAVHLFSDLLRNGCGASMNSVEGGGGEMVLAHLLHGQATSSGPLTRRGWRKLVEKSGVSVYGSHFSVEDEDNIWNRHSFDGSDATPADSFNTTVCVICTNGQREIVCWPCRCLAMCDNCREALASQSAPTKHCCPCCRQTVEGYSRIYIP